MSNWDQLQHKIDVKVNKLTVPVGRVSGTVLTVIGSIGAMGFGISTTVMIILRLTPLGFDIGFNILAMFFFFAFLISVSAIVKGNNINKRLLRFQRYNMRLKNRYHCPIKELSTATGQNDKDTAKDLKKMIEIGMYPQGHIDEQDVYFILNNKYYEEYTRLQHDAKMKTLELETLKIENRRKVSDQEAKSLLTKEDQKVVDDGRALIKEIKRANDLIPGKELSNKLNKLENIGEKIFEYVEVHPEKLPQIKRFTQYFLPTTLKLADTYAKLDHQPIQGANISTAKREIEATMDTIYHAFENLLDGLFEDIALDISTDISVLETIFAQEGLTDCTINTHKEINGGK